jgi:hypothetical protein
MQMVGCRRWPLVRRGSEFGLLRDVEKRTQILGRSLAGVRGPGPRFPGAINRFRRMCWLVLSERKQEWLPKAATVAGGARDSGVQKTCRRHLSDARVASQQSPVLRRDTGGYVRVRRLSRGFSMRSRFSLPLAVSSCSPSFAKNTKLPAILMSATSIFQCLCAVSG